MNDTVHVVCPHCFAVNRVPTDRLHQGPNCGKCHQPLFPGHPVELDEARFDAYLTKNDLPVLVDFWAPWCGPCRMMAPAFAHAASQLAPRVLLAKLNTDEAQETAARYGIRSIPTMILFHQGREVARHSGAVGTAEIVRWTQSHL
ncbi:MAG: thioredoxin TrxC [Tepidiphilus sp.]|jgi:thioredoxin 2|uniref:Thioredoxin n=1 Tax=Tepidiphilus thermophilus TaxID=876478 RepID=A0A0K6IWP4_9PROT|nr:MULTISPECIES: thioredoxin TrxC [Tepidiphilus]MBP6998919.1 thioredoxin TrxC [Tepidiphilus sp.]CUB07535.1 thioredoxin [Tepidiphilus thermophilus]